LRATAPHYDVSTVGLAHSQDPDGTAAQTMAALLGHDDASPDAADIASDPDDVPERSKAFLLMGGSLTAIFVAGVYALATMTTFEIPGLTLPSRWQMISALEAVNGVLLFGISTAYFFVVIQVHWQLLSHRHERWNDH